MATFLTPNRHGYSVRFSPFNADELVVATSQYFGLAGGGTLFVLKVTPDNQLIEKQKLEWTDGLFDVVYSEYDPTLVVSASGDGGLQLWNILCNEGPVKSFKEHDKEVYSVDWSRTRQEQLILSASWDASIKIWDPNRDRSLNTFHGHSELVYNAMWSPLVANCFASVSRDGTIKIWSSQNPSNPSLSFKVHDAEVLSCDWCKYDQNVLATGGSDGFIRGWDLRNFFHPIFQLKASEYAVRRVQFSPYTMSMIASVSYDFTTRIFDFKKSLEALEVVKHHSEFVYGLDWNNLREGQLADCGWDSLVHVFTPKSILQ